MVDAVDEQIVQLLQNNPRQSAETLAAKVHLSASTVRRRIRKLVQSQALRTVLSTGPAKAGFPVISVIGMNVRPDKIESAMRVLSNRPEVRWVSTTTGRFDIMALVLFRSTEGLSSFVRREIAKIEGLSGTETFICLELIPISSAVSY